MTRRINTEAERLAYMASSPPKPPTLQDEVVGLRADVARLHIAITALTAALAVDKGFDLA